VHRAHGNSRRQPFTCSCRRRIESTERELTTLAGHINAANYRFLVLLGGSMRGMGTLGLGSRPARIG
jgi:hypothetical protein